MVSDSIIILGLSYLIVYFLIDKNLTKNNPFMKIVAGSLYIGLGALSMVLFEDTSSYGFPIILLIIGIIVFLSYFRKAIKKVVD